jgi:hypothetical protein
MKIKSPIGFLALWSAFLAVGTWILPMGVLNLTAAPVYASAPTADEELTELQDAFNLLRTQIEDGTFDVAAFQYGGSDFDGDGFGETLLVQPSRTLKFDGNLAVVDGATGNSLFELRAFDGEHLFGEHLAVVQDCDGDGVLELVVGTVVIDNTGHRGRARIHSGATGKLLCVSESHGGPGTTTEPAIVHREAGDQNGDGLVTNHDVDLVAGFVGASAGTTPCSDLDMDGLVTTSDVVEVLLKAADPVGGESSEELQVAVQNLQITQVVGPVVVGPAGAPPPCVTGWIGGWSCWMTVLAMVAEVVLMLTIAIACVPSGASVTPAALPCLYLSVCTFAAFLGTLMSFVNSCLTTCPNSVLGKLGSTLVAIGGHL